MQSGNEMQELTVYRYLPVSPKAFPEQKSILFFPAARQQQSSLHKLSAGPSHTDSTVQVLGAQKPRLIQSLKFSQSTVKPPQTNREELNIQQVVLL